MSRNEEVKQKVGKRFFNSINGVWRIHNIRANYTHTQHKISPALFTFFFSLRDPNDVKSALSLDKQIMAAGHFDKLVSFQRGRHIVYQLPLPERYRQTVSASELKAGAIGLDYNAEPYSFTFNQSHPHTVLFGSTGSGKTVSLAGIAHSLFRTHKPDQLKALVCDPLSKFSYMDNLLYLATQPARTPEQMETVINYAVSEFEHRKTNGLSDDKIPYKLVVLIDELSECFRAKADWQKYTMLTAKGRQFGIHLVGDIQTSERDVPMTYFENTTNRFLGFVSSQRTATQLAGVTGVSATNSVGKGDFFHTQGANKNRLQFAYVTEQDFVDLPRGEVKQIETMPTSQALERLDNIPTPQTGRPTVDHSMSDLATSYNFCLVNKRLMSFAEIEKVLNLGRRPAERLRVATIQFLEADIDIKRDYLNTLGALVNGNR